MSDAKPDLVKTMRAGAEALIETGNAGGYAFDLHVAANHMIDLLSGQITARQLKELYAAPTAAKLDVINRFSDDDPTDD